MTIGSEPGQSARCKTDEAVANTSASVSMDGKTVEGGADSIKFAKGKERPSARKALTDTNLSAIIHSQNLTPAGIFG